MIASNLLILQMRKQLKPHNLVLLYNKPAQNMEKSNKQAPGEEAELLNRYTFNY